MKKILFLLSVAIFAVNCGSNEGPETPTPPQSKYKKYAGDDELKIMSFNLRTSGMDKGTANHWDNRKAACVSLIRDHKPTIMGVQEATYTDQWDWLRKQLKSDGYDGYGVNRQTGKESGAGEVPGILYDTKVIKKIEVGTFWLSETPDKPSKGWDANYYRSATWGLFQHIPSGEEFFFVNTHLDHESTTAQVEGMKLIAAKLKEYKDDCPVYLTGDFNVLATDKAMNAISDFMRNARMYAYPTDKYGTTNGFNTSSSTKTIDHIYYRKDLKPVEYYTIREAYEGVTYVSDHFPIYAIVKIKK